MRLAFCGFLLSLVYGARLGDGTWDAVDLVLSSAIANRVFPGCSAAVLDANGTQLYARSFGSFVYGDSPPPPLNGGGNPPVTFAATRFDMASLTKIVATTTAAALLHDAGLLSLDTLVTSLLGASFAAHGKANVTVRHLLLHAAGFPADPSPGYSEPAFGCPGGGGGGTPPLDFSCTQRVFEAVLAQPLVAAPGAVFLYSDLSMITLAFALGRLLLDAAPGWVPPAAGGAACAVAAARPDAPPGLRAACAFEAFWRSNVSTPLRLSPATGFLPSAPGGEPGAAAPTWFDATYRRAQLQGVVSDENSYAAGGVLGHAGLFATGADAAALLAAWGAGAGRPALLSDAAVAMFTARQDAPPGSPRALGWSTMAPSDGYLGCAPMAEDTAYHTGYTGTLLCRGPAYSTLLLAARVFPNKTANVDEIHAARQAFNTAVAAVMAAGAQ
jgi:CubicO group peptidase (beta-lactamase class C family)